MQQHEDTNNEAGDNNKYQRQKQKRELLLVRIPLERAVDKGCPTGHATGKPSARQEVAQLNRPPQIESNKYRARLQKVEHDLRSNVCKPAVQSAHLQRTVP